MEVTAQTVPLLRKSDPGIAVYVDGVRKRQSAPGNERESGQTKKERCSPSYGGYVPLPMPALVLAQTLPARVYPEPFYKMICEYAL